MTSATALRAPLRMPMVTAGHQRETVVNVVAAEDAVAVDVAEGAEAKATGTLLRRMAAVLASKASRLGDIAPGNLSTLRVYQHPRATAPITTTAAATIATLARDAERALQKVTSRVGRIGTRPANPACLRNRHTRSQK